MPQLIQSLNIESFRYSLYCNNITMMTIMVDKSRPFGNWNVRIQCTFPIQYCIIIYIPWRMSLWFMPRPEHSRSRPRTQTQVQGQGRQYLKAKDKKFGLKAKAKDANIRDLAYWSIQINSQCR